MAKPEKLMCDECGSVKPTDYTTMFGNGRRYCCECISKMRLCVECNIPYPDDMLFSGSCCGCLLADEMRGENVLPLVKSGGAA